MLTDNFSSKKLTSSISANAPSILIKKLYVVLEDANNQEETLVAFMDGTSAEMDIEDGVYFGGGSLTLCSASSDDKNLAINFLPLDKKTEIKLNVNASGADALKLNFPSLSDFGDVQIFLKDAYTNKVELINQNPVYDFTVDKKIAETFGSARFKLIFQPTITSSGFTAKKIYSGSELSWDMVNTVAPASSEQST